MSITDLPLPGKPEHEPRPLLATRDQDLRCAGFALSDIGNAERIRERCKDVLQFIADEGCWLHWDGQRWARDEGAVIRCAMDAMRAIDCEVVAEPSDKRRAELREHAARSQSRSAINAALELARVLVGIEIRSSQLDVDAWLLNCPNGTVDLRTGEMRAHRREDFITKITMAEYEPTATSDVLTNFLRDATGGNAELESFLRRAFGYTSTGSTREEKLFFIHGPGAAGKSTLVEAVKSALGDYVKVADFDAFLQRRNSGGARGDIARLAAARFVPSVEVDDGQRLAEGLVKQLSGGDTITARHLYQSEFEFRPQFKLWLCANDRPRVRDNDSGLWRRIVTIPFEHAVPAEKRDPRVKATLSDPAKGGRAVLAWLVRGAVEWNRDGLKVPAIVEAATAAYREAMDPLRAWLSEWCYVGNSLDLIVASALRANYEEWCRANGQRYPLGAREFNSRIERLGCHQKPKKFNGSVTRCWFGIRLRQVDEDPQEARRLQVTEGNGILPKLPPAYGREKVMAETCNFPLPVTSNPDYEALVAIRDAVDQASGMGRP